MRNVLLEAVLVGAAALAMAFASNALSPRGLSLTRNYSPGSALAAARLPAGAGGPNSSNTGGSSPPGLDPGILKAQLRAEGLQFADDNDVAQLFAGPKRSQELVIFIDARDDDHYESGHIPGAYQLDHYHPEKYLSAVLPACQAAEKVVVYCKGGTCEDSEQTALLLRDASGVAKDKLFVYTGGFDEWVAKQQPVELGQRNSGQLERPNPPQGAGPNSAK